MNKRRIKIVIAFSILALIGSVAIQYYWISMLYDQNKFLFDQRVEKALKYAIHSLEKQEHLYHIKNRQWDAHHLLEEEIDDQAKEISAYYNENLRDEQELIINSHYDSGKKSLIVINNKILDPQIEFINVENNWIFENGEENMEATVHIKLENDSVFQYFEATADSLIQVLEYKTIALKDEKNNIDATIDQLVWEMDEWYKPFGDSIPSDLIRSMVTKSLEEYRLPLHFEFAVMDSSNQDVILFESQNFEKEEVKASYFSNLYPNELIPRERFIYLQMKNQHLFAPLSKPIALSVAFTFMLSIGLLLIIKNLLHHRKVSEVQNDFINNMTHEFKTPIATISLASDSILSPSILNNQEKVSYFTGMIKKENKRMNRLVEKILQMAKLENKELKLDLQTVNIHSILQAIIENLQVKIKGQGEINSCFDADIFNIEADHVHLTNVFYNLLENAIKYSEKPISIDIKTHSSRHHISILVKDHGQGMNKKELPHIFDRFYRIEAGNVHNVKGYGLGLTYVKAIIEKHGGSIFVKSEINKGSTFEIKLPFHH